MNEFKQVTKSTGSFWSVANVRGSAATPVGNDSAATPVGNDSAATRVSNVDEFRQFLLAQLRKPRIAGLDWSLSALNEKQRWTTRFGRPLRSR